MVAVDDRERIDAPLDRGISGDDLRRARAAGVEVDQAGDDLEVVLDAMMHLARELGLADQPFGEVGLVQRHGAADGAESFAEFANLRSEEHTSELQSLMRISYAVFCLKKKKKEQRMARARQNNKESIVQHIQC